VPEGYGRTALDAKIKTVLFGGASGPQAIGSRGDADTVTCKVFDVQSNHSVCRLNTITNYSAPTERHNKFGKWWPRPQGVRGMGRDRGRGSHIHENRPRVYRSADVRRIKLC
jgi:hypothetical protein